MNKQEIEMSGCREWSLDGAVLTTPYVLQVCVCVCVCAASVSQSNYTETESHPMRDVYFEKRSQLSPGFTCQTESPAATSSCITCWIWTSWREKSCYVTPLLCSGRVLVCASEHSTVASSDSLQPTSTDHTFLSVMSCCCAATVTPHRGTFT